MTIRDEVLAHLVETMAKAEADGRDPFAAAKSAYPDTPASVLGQALWMLEESKTETWWHGIEKTIDAEVVHRALQSQSASRSPGDSSHG